MGFPVKLADIHATIDDMDAVITKALSGIDVRVWPYEVTPDLILDAVKRSSKLLYKITLQGVPLKFPMI